MGTAASSSRVQEVVAPRLLPERLPPAALQSLAREAGLEALQGVAGPTWPAALRRVPPGSVGLLVVGFPYQPADRLRPFRLPATGGTGVRGEPTPPGAACRYLAACAAVLQAARPCLHEAAAVFVADLPRWLPYHGLQLEALGLTFKYWLAVGSGVPPGTRLVPREPVHTGILFSVTDPKRVRVETVREPHRRCRRCGEPLADWGGKKARRHPAGRVISDIWVEPTWPVDGRPWHVPVPSLAPEPPPGPAAAGPGAAAGEPGPPGGTVLARLLRLARGGVARCLLLLPEFTLPPTSPAAGGG